MSAVATRFGTVVRSKLVENKIAGVKPDSIRGLARVMARGDDALAQTYKRSLFKWMAPGGPTPTDSSRALVAHHLGIETEELAEPDEESDPVAALVNQIRLLARAEAAEAVNVLRTELAKERS